MEENTLFYQPEKQKILHKKHAITIFDGNAEAKTIDLDTFNKRRITYGRSKSNDIVISSRIVSKSHGYFLLEKEKYFIYDNNSTNGIFFNNKMITQKEMMTGDIFRIDNPAEPIEKGVTILYNVNEKISGWTEFIIDDKQIITIGRKKECDIYLNHISVSNIHAKIIKEENDYYIYDNNSTNGISINNKLVKTKKLLKEKDVIIITNTKLVFTKKKISYQCVTEGIGLSAIDIVKTVKKKNGIENIVNHINLTINPGELVAIIGGSGAGKTTFMNCISGYNKATSGEVLINEVTLYQNYEALKGVIGYVPQQDIVYDNLRLRNMLEYTAKLRMPIDMTDNERLARIQEVIDMVELSGKRGFIYKGIKWWSKKTCKYCS